MCEKMKDVIVIISDSLSYEENMLDDMPRLNARRENLITFNNYFAQAPYTEAATVPIYTASNVTDYQGHINNLKGRPMNINELFKSLGYKTYNTLWFYANTLSFLRGVDEYDYMTSGVSLDITTYRLEYFRELYLNDGFDNNSMEMLVALLDDFFEMTQIYIYDYYNHPEKFDLLLEYTEFEKDIFEEFVLKEAKNRNKYYENKELFVKDVLENKNDFFNKDYSKSKRSNYFNEHMSKINRSMLPILAKQVFYAIKNYATNNSLKVLKHRLKNRENQSILKTFRSWIGHIGSYPGRYAYEFLSAKVILERTFEYLESNQNEKNFVLMHLMDTHSPFNFLSSEYEELGEDLDKLNTYQKDFKQNNNNIYRYSKLYVDDKIGDFIDNLEKSGMLEDTTIIITSDHGSSYLGKIYRNEITSTFYDENYRIPLMIYNKNMKSADIDNLSISKQLIPTLLDILKENKYDELIKENSIFQNDKDYIIFEYFGAGCPDYKRKSKLFCIRSERYKIQYEKFPITSNMQDQVLAIYDLSNDPKELENLKDTLQDNEEIDKLLQALYRRIYNVL